MHGVDLVIAALCVLCAALFLVAAPRRDVRGLALAATILVTTIAGNNSVPRDVWVPAFAFCALLLLIALGRRPLTRRIGRTGFPVIAGWWAFLTVGVVVERSYSLPRLAAYFGLAVIVAFAMSQLTRRELRIVLAALLGAAVMETAWAGVEVAFRLTPLWGYRGGYTSTNPLLGDTVTRAQGSMGQPIILGVLCGLGVLVAWSNRIGMRRALRAAMLVTTLGGVWLSGTRSVLLALATALAAHLLLRGRLAAWLRNLLLAGVIAGIIAVLNFGIPRLVAELVSSGSFSHRLGSIEAVPNLLARPLAQSLWGSGFGSEVSLFTKGYIAETFGLQVVDDYFVYLLGTSGVIGLLAFVGVLVWAFCRADRQGRAVIVFLVTMFLSFDVLVWTYTGLLLSMLLVIPPDRPAQRGGLDDVRVRAPRAASAAVTVEARTPRATPRRPRPRQIPALPDAFVSGRRSPAAPRQGRR